MVCGNNMQDSKLKELEDEVSRFGTHQIKGIAYFLTLLGGAIDAVSYMGFDHTLPVAQTGNLLLLMVDITRLNVQGIAIKMTTLLSFIAGLVVSRCAYHYYRSIYWRIYILVGLSAACLFAFLAFDHLPGGLAIAPLSFTLAMTTGAFNKVENELYNNSFTTGNIKKAIIAWCGFLFKGQAEQKEQAVIFTCLVLSFVIGAFTAALFYSWFGMAALLVILCEIIMFTVWYFLLIRFSQKS